MSGDAADEVRARLDILDVVGGYVALHRAGREHVGLCPFHSEKTPSFSVSQERQVFHCHGCGAGGDIFSFIEKIEGVDFRRALETLADRAGVELERSPRAAARGAARRRSLELNDRAARYFQYVLWSLPAGEPGRRLLAERGVADDLAHRFGVGFAPAGGPGGNGLVRYLAAHDVSLADAAEAGLASRGGRDLFRERLVFPIADERGRVLGFGGRALGGAIPKYLNTPETGLYHKSTALFGLDQARDALRQRRLAVVVEGYFDVLAAHAAGVTNTVASSGTALTRDQVRILARHADHVVLCFDGDDAGRKAASRAVDLCAAESLPARIAVMPAGFKDPDEMVRRDPPGFAALVAEAAPEWQVLVQWAIGDPGPALDERRAAADRVVTVLARIPEATTRDLCIQDASRRLELSASALATDVARARSSGSRAPRPAAPMPPAPPPVEEGQGLLTEETRNPAPSWEEYLGGFAVQQPGLARILVEEMGLDLAELANPGVRRLLQAALATPAGAALSLHPLQPADQRLAARLLMREIPELGPAPDPIALQRAMADCVGQVHRAALRERTNREIRKLLAAADGGDPAHDETVVASIRQLIADQRGSFG